MSFAIHVDHAVERVLRRDRLLAIGGLIGITALSWAYLLYLAAQMDMSGMEAGISEMLKLKPWTPVDAALMFAMWAVMMVGMMVPSATPMILLYARVLRRQASDREPLVPSSAFLAGYLSIWMGFSAAATALQWGLEQTALLSPMMVATGPVFGGIVLIVAGVYQLTPYKSACLEHCRSPIWYLSKHWRHGTGGAYLMGLQHGAFCLGCCWALMALLFVGGVMNLLCVAAITLFVLLEKVAPLGMHLGRGAAALLVLSGLVMVGVA